MDECELKDLPLIDCRFEDMEIYSIILPNRLSAEALALLRRNDLNYFEHEYDDDNGIIFVPENKIMEVLKTFSAHQFKIKMRLT